jgi:hypothetical protein
MKRSRNLNCNLSTVETKTVIIVTVPQHWLEHKKLLKIKRSFLHKKINVESLESSHLLAILIFPLYQSIPVIEFWDVPCHAIGGS